MSDNPYDAGQALASLNKPDDATIPINLAAIAHELRTANLIAAADQLGWASFKIDGIPIATYVANRLKMETRI